MIHRTVELDFERIHPVRPRRTNHRLQLAMLQTIARDILTGQRIVHSASPRQFRQYGRKLPTLVGLRFEISCQRTRRLGHKQRMGIVRGAEFESFVERRQDFRAEHYATGLRRRRTAHTRRTI